MEAFEEQVSTSTHEASSPEQPATLTPATAVTKTNAASAAMATAAVRKRALTACRLCRKRKVRCNVTAVGIPCINCVRDDRNCEVSRRKRRSQPNKPTPVIRVPEAPVPEKQTSTTRINISNSADTTIASITASTTVQSHSHSHPHAYLNGAVVEDREVPEPDEEAIESLALAIMDGKAEGKADPFYVGEQQGVGYIFDIVGQSSGSGAPQPKHYNLPHTATIDLDSDDLTYLRAKGVLSLPKDNICQALFEAYFGHVHPILPVIDAEAVLAAFHDGGPTRVNLLLLWSMFSAAVNYVDDAVVRRAGYLSHKDMKKAMFLRAKCLYDNGREKDRIVLIQAVSLLAFWFADLDEKTESWHWMGIAISLSQTLGLNRNPDLGQYNLRPSDRQRRLWRRIWWCCVFRDRWLSLGMGRPLRINVEDCDNPMPSVKDVIDDLLNLPQLILDKYVPPDMHQLAEQWVVLLNISNVLGSILSKNYRPNVPLPTRHWVEATEKQLVRYAIQAGERPPDASRSLAFYTYHLHLHYEAATISLWRPYIKRAVTGIAPEQENAWSSIVQQKIRTAAANTNTILDKIIGEQLISSIGPMTVPVLVPAMHTHLLESKSADPLTIQSSLLKLNLCMMVLKKIQGIYSSATFIHGLFLTAIEKLHGQRAQGMVSTTISNNHRMLPNQSYKTPDSASSQQLGPLRENLGQGPINDDFPRIDEWISDFWDPLPPFPMDFAEQMDLGVNTEDMRNFDEFGSLFSVP